MDSSKGSAEGVTAAEAVLVADSTVLERAGTELKSLQTRKEQRQGIEIKSLQTRVAEFEQKRQRATELCEHEKGNLENISAETAGEGQQNEGERQLRRVGSRQ
jgi:hypothetical protein